jgi:hypothetical protein
MKKKNKAGREGKKKKTKPQKNNALCKDAQIKKKKKTN